MEKQTFVTAVRQAMERRGFTQADLAERVGVQQPTISDWINGKKRPSAANLDKLLEALGLSRDEVEQPRRRPTMKDLEDEESDIVMLPHVAYVSAGEGYHNGEYREVDELAFSRRELRRITNTSPEKLSTMTVVGDSMEPLIRANDTVCYEPTHEITDDGLYVFLLDEMMKVKMVQRYAGGALLIIPANPAYEKEMLVPLEEADTPNMYTSRESGLIGRFKVVGKVKGYLRPA